MPNKLIEKIRAYLKEIDLESLQHKYQDQSTNDDFIDYEPLPQKMVDDSNEELDQALQFKINKWGF
tara:strand:- start:147 stop:344 length:198 start_codon:yes stop_codon:yes gene_type:complete